MSQGLQIGDKVITVGKLKGVVANITCSNGVDIEWENGTITYHSAYQSKKIKSSRYITSVGSNRFNAIMLDVSTMRDEKLEKVLNEI